MKVRFFVLFFALILAPFVLYSKVIVIYSSQIPRAAEFLQGLRQEISEKNLRYFNLDIDADESILNVYNPIRDKVIALGSDAGYWALAHLGKKNIYFLVFISAKKPSNGFYFFPQPAELYSAITEMKRDTKKIGLLSSTAFENGNKSFETRVKRFFQRKGIRAYDINIPKNFTKTKKELISEMGNVDVNITMPDERVLSYPYFKILVRISIIDSTPLITLTRKLLDMGAALAFEPDFYELGLEAGKNVLSGTQGWYFSPMKELTNKHILKILGLNRE